MVKFAIWSKNPPLTSIKQTKQKSGKDLFLGELFSMIFFCLKRNIEKFFTAQRLKLKITVSRHIFIVTD